MPRYLIQRSFPDGLEIPSTPAGRETFRTVVANNLAEQVTWIHSYVSADHRTTYCIYDGPSPEALRRAAGSSGLPVSSITEVDVLDPYFYVGASPSADGGAT